MRSNASYSLNYVAHKLLALNGIHLPVQTPLSEAMKLLKINPIPLPKPTKSISDFVPINLELTPTINEPEDSLVLLAQGLSWLAVNKNSSNEKKIDLEKNLADLIEENVYDLFKMYHQYPLFNLILRSGSKTIIAKAAKSIDIRSDEQTMDDLSEMRAPFPNGENIRLSALKGGYMAGINLVDYICKSVGSPQIINADFLSEVEGLIAIEKDPNEKLALEQGYAICNESLKMQNELMKSAKKEAEIENIKQAIRCNKTSHLNQYINAITSSSDEINHLKSFLALAIDNNKHESIFYLANRMKELGIMNENECLNVCSKHIPYSKLYELFKENQGCMTLDLSSDLLNCESIQFIIQHFPENYKQLIYKVANRKLKALLNDNVLLDLFLHSDQTRVIIKKSINNLSASDLSSLVNKDNYSTFLSLALASGIRQECIQEIVDKNAYDYLNILLIAASYPGTRFTTEMLINFLNAKNHPHSLHISESHLFLAQKLKDTELNNGIIKKLKNDKKILTETENERLNHLQGRLRITNRANEVYPTLFGKRETYDYWMHEKTATRHDALLKDKDLGYLASKYIDAHHVVDYPYHVPVFLPVSKTSQHVKENTNYNSLMQSAYLLSETARSNVGVGKMPSMLHASDKVIRDQDLVFTAPFQTAFTIEKHYCSIIFNLEKLPPSYLNHAIIKLGDYVARKNFSSPQIQIAPEVTVDSEYRDTNMCKYTFTHKDASGDVHAITVNIPGSDEIYHGINGFKESLCHIFYIINSLSETIEGNLIKWKILESFFQMDKDGLLKDHLNLVFKKLNAYMEIDFLGGLPLSLQYIDSIYFIETKTMFTTKELYPLIEKGNQADFEAFFIKYPQLRNQLFIIKEILNLAPAYRLNEIAQILETLSPTCYLSITEHLIDVVNLNKKDLKATAMQLSLLDNEDTTLDLEKLISQLKTTLSDDKYIEIRKQLMQLYKQEALALCEKVKAIYKDVQFAGNNSIMREIMTNPEIIGALTGNNKSLLAAILAFDIEAKREGKTCDVTFVAHAKSQQSGEMIDYTLGTILSTALAQPKFFIAACPLNIRNETIDEAAALRDYIRQKVFSEKLIQKVESSLVDLCQLYDPLHNADIFLLIKENHLKPYQPKEWKNNEYPTLLEKVSGFVSGNDFCANPHVSSEVNEGISILISALCPKENVVIDKSAGSLILKETSFKNFMKNFLSTGLILNPKISHFLFDTLHFGVALTRGNEIKKIQFKDVIITFKDLIRLAMDMIVQNGANKNNAILAEQLALRSKMLESWCVEHKKFAPQADQNKLRICK